MKYTNLELVQKILSSMDGDEINSIGDTTEAGQVLSCVETAYWDLVTIGELTRDDDVFQLTPSLDTALPVTMYLPNDVTNIRWIKYDNQTATDTTVNYQPVYPMEFADFIQMSTNLSTAASNVFSYEYTSGGQSFTLYANNDRAPRYYTTPNDNTILFDGYDAAVDATLQASKVMCFGQKTFTWSGADNFILPLDDKQFQRLLHEAKALAFAELKQTPHAKAEKMARDIKIDQQSSKHKINLQSDYDLIPNFGRRGNYGRLKPTGRYK